MPLRHSRRSRRKRKRVYRRRSTKKVGLGTSLTRNLRFATVPEDVTVPLGGVSTIAWSANGMYDPDTRVGGHQPRTFDQIMAMYDHFVVSRAKLRVWVQSTAVNGLIFGITLRDTASASTDIRDYLEDPHTMYAVTDSSSPGPKHMSLSCNIGKFLGRKIFGDSQLKGSAGANPTEQVYFHFWQANLDDGESTSTSYVQTSIDYRSTFIEPKIPALS